MHRHGPSDYTGPLRGTTAWWHGTQEASGHPPDSNPDNPTPGPNKDDPDMRRDLIDRVRREIAAGTYDSPDKWLAALDRMLGRLEGD